MFSHTISRTGPVVRRSLMLLGALALMGLPLHAQTAVPGRQAAAPVADELTVVSTGQHLSVEEILARHYEATGGDRQQQLQSMRVDGRSIVMGMETSYTRYAKRPNKMLLEIYVQGMTGVQAFDGEVAWAYMPFMGQSAPAAMPPSEAQAVLEGSDFDGPLVHAEKKGHHVELTGTEPVNGREAYVLEVTLKTGGVQTHYVDTETFHVTRAVTSAGEALFLEYRDFEGFPMPSVIEMMGPMGEQIIYVDEVAFNVEIDDAAFIMQ